MNKYNYVVLGADGDLYRFSYSDLESVGYAKYVPGLYSNMSGLRKLLCKMHFNRWVNFPLKSMWFNTFVNIRFPVEKPICFIVFCGWVCLNINIVSFLRKNFKNCKIVWICSDLISTKRMLYTNEPLNPKVLMPQFDLALSFDQGDCEKHGFVYHPLVFSEYQNLKESMPESDLYMLALAKNRLDDIYAVYEVLRTKGLKLDINLVGVKPECQRFKEEIHFLDKGMSYAENLQHILHTKCILEIMQKNGSGFTQRGCEAVCLGKKMLTNNAFIKGEPFFRSEYISTFTSPNDIDDEFVRHIIDDVDVDFKYKEKMSPIALLDFIEEKLP